MWKNIKHFFSEEKKWSAATEKMAAHISPLYLINRVNDRKSYPLGICYELEYTTESKNALISKGDK